MDGGEGRKGGGIYEFLAKITEEIFQRDDDALQNVVSKEVDVKQRVVVEQEKGGGRSGGREEER